jgi:hypothetical protein
MRIEQYVENEAWGFSVFNYGRISYANYATMLSGEEVEKRAEVLKRWEIMAFSIMREGVYVRGELHDDWDRSNDDLYDDIVYLS